MEENDSAHPEGEEAKKSNESLASHYGSYIGKTVTVYTVSGSTANMGTTGVLTGCSSSHISILTSFGLKPANAYHSFCSSCPFKKICKSNKARSAAGSTGSITEIPIEKIVAFIHNTV